MQVGLQGLPKPPEPRPSNTDNKILGLRLPQQPAALAERSLQVNINSQDDAKAVVQHLGRIKQAFELANCRSIEFCIAEDVAPKCETTLTGVINWCKTYVKHVAPFEGNVHFSLPHYVPPVVRESPKPTGDAISSTSLPDPKPVPASYRNPERLEQVKTNRQVQRPVPATTEPT